ncbi:hypothetical protein MUB24_08220 [Lederbergia sp. NSJ-179]|uniref:hypothetical protein n=1 Tax=Lederbergia sp. NSJ-179 TaxID=2931402 RepID=UPI001FCF8B35|nr:hypothetical protein [Lederbergia sp. NSJ-179]MCJ7840889.1 hypothetical protein [Lederbergia sp. NSJ-179]
MNTKEDAAKAIGAETPLPPHVGAAEDIANGIIYLASDDSKFVMVFIKKKTSCYS